ncbi:MAG: DegT/DnrJ/EryC1/StrS family aminotransferase [Planctomycetota bacterium]|nr:DegT/DnrJ/EryC1/StrS family aminotransferase [Planctomycetota bacterium]
MQVKLLDLTAQYVGLRGEIRKVIDEVCDAQAFVLGPTVERFEKHLAEYCGTKYAIGVSSGTDALLCALMAIGIGDGDEVITTPFTFFATAGSIARLQARPVFVDIDPGTFNMDPRKVEAKITRRTRAIMPVHLFGQVADMDGIGRIAQKHGLAVVEDAAQAIGAKRDGKAACAFGLCGCLSFYPTKNLGGFGDGGAICTSDEGFAGQCRLLRVHGTPGNNPYLHLELGGMFRLDALQAAVLDVKLKYLNEWHEGRRRNAAMYDRLLAGSKVKTPAIEAGNWSVYNQYVVRVENRDAVKAKLAAGGVGSAVYYPMPLHLQKCFLGLGYRAGDFPEAEQACGEVLALPVYPELAEEQIRYVAKVLLEATGS